VSAESFVPEEYYANYQIADEWSLLLDLIIDLDAAQKVGAEVEQDTFYDLHDIFETVFDFFPSDPASELTYRKCLLTTEELKEEVTKNGYTKFREQCFNPMSDLLAKIRSKFTVEARIAAKPKQGNTPLNVTLDARESLDPSNDTIPSDYFFWWYKDVEWNEQKIWKWPVVNYTFEDEGNHIVHLTVRSSNNETEWIFDGEDSIAINVAPKSANIVIYANGKLLGTDDTVRIGTQDAQEGILIDGTSTTPIGARTILEYVRTITNSQLQYNFKRSGEWSPWQFVHAFPRNWVYQIQLDLVDNENNKITEKYTLSVSDPVAFIRFSPEEGTTSDTYSFDASASYSLTSRVKTYQWEITDPAWAKIDVLETKQLKRKFSSPGIYTVKLTVVDELWNDSYDTEQFYVASTPPIPSFTIESSTDLEHPSQFFLDAWASFDEDILNWNDKLSYFWSFAPNEWVDILSQDDADQRILVTFNEPWVYTAKLRVEDEYGEIAEIEKEIEVISSLRPELYLSPIVAHWGTQMSLTATTNKPVSFYERDLGDGKSQSSSEPSINYTYQKAWVYTISLRVVTQWWEENTIRQQVFMGQKDMPIVAYEIKGKQNKLLQPDWTCDTGSWSVWAFQVDRYDSIIVDAYESLNTQWTKLDLSITIHPQNDEVYAKQTLTYSFPELWCTYMDIYVEDRNVGKTEKKTVWFDVQNALPTINNLVLDFPQPGWWGNVGVWAATETVSNREIFSDSSIDPIVVRVQAKGTRDNDGFISHYAWYYYESNNPDNIVSLKITPADVTSTSFIVPKPTNPTEYAFAVRMVDNDWWEVTSEDVLGKWPIIFFPPGENNLDVPIVTLKTNSFQAKVWDPVTFSTDARILSQKPDFDATRYFKYDFDGDWIYDLTTKQSEVSHVFEEAGEVKPKVAVYYRGRAWIWLSETLIIQKWLKPVLLTDTFWTKILAKDASWWDIEDTTICLDIRECRAKTSWWIRKNEDVVYFDYEQPWSYFLQFDVIDAFGNSQEIRDKVDLEAANWLGILSIPSVIENNGKKEISVWSTLDNEIVFHVVYEAWNCFVDLDITHDSDKDWDPVNDDDASCNSTETVKFLPTQKEQIMRVWYADGTRKQQDVSVVFLDYEDVLPEELQWAVDEIDEVLSTLPVETDTDILWFYKDLLINLKSSLGETDEMNSLVIQLRDLLIERPDVLTKEQQERLTMLLNSLSDETVQQVFGGTEYDTAKSNITAWFDGDVSEEVQELFQAFENAEWNKDDMKVALDTIFQVTWRERQAWNIDVVDFAYIQKNLCDIIIYYELPSKTCGTAIDISDPDLDRTWGETNEWSDESSSASRGILRIVIIVVVFLAAIFAVLVVLFAIKARRQRNYDDEEEFDDDYEYDDFVYEEAPEVSQEESDTSQEVPTDAPQEEGSEIESEWNTPKNE